MDLTLNRAVLGLELSGIRRFTFLVRDTPGACALTIGEPDQNTPDVVKEAAKAALDRNDTHYPPGNGYPYMLEAISKFEERAHGLKYSPDEIILTIGATESLFIGLSTVLNPGDEVIIPTPAFSLYESITQLCRGVPVALPTEDNRFQIDPRALESAITPRTKAIVLTSPNNPTGCIYTKETLDAIHEVLKDRPIFVLCDDVYRSLVYTEDYHSFAEFDDCRDRIIVINSFSKPYAMTGWRLGWCLADAPIRDRMQIFHQYAVVSAPAFVQPACAAALESDTSSMTELFRKRRDFSGAARPSRAAPIHSVLRFSRKVNFRVLSGSDIFRHSQDNDRIRFFTRSGILRQNQTDAVFLFDHFHRSAVKQSRV